MDRAPRRRSKDGRIRFGDGWLRVDSPLVSLVPWQHAQHHDGIVLGLEQHTVLAYAEPIFWWVAVGEFTNIAVAGFSESGDAGPDSSGVISPDLREVF